VSEQTDDALELDELYWFVGQKGKGETRENVYLITMVSREPRQIVGFAVAFDKSPQRIQGIVDSAPPALKYCTDGYLGYVDVVYPGQHVRKIIPPIPQNFDIRAPRRRVDERQLHQNCRHARAAQHAKRAPRRRGVQFYPAVAQPRGGGTKATLRAHCQATEYGWDALAVREMPG